MSRTKRHIPFWVRSYFLGKDWNNTHVMLGAYLDHPYFTNPRSALYYGRDDNHSRSYVYMGYPTKGWPETFGKTTRKFYKRRFNKQRRAVNKRYDWLNEY